MHNRHHHKQATVAQTGLIGPKTMPQTAVTSRDTKHGHQVSADDIRLCAYRKWKNAGMPTGDGTQFWLDAEKELTVGK